MTTKEDDLTPHAIVLHDNAPVAICLSRGIAENLARCCYKPESYTIRPATKFDIECVME